MKLREKQKKGKKKMKERGEVTFPRCILENDAVERLAEDRRIQQYHADNNQHTDDSPGRLNSLLMFFVEKHILNIPYVRIFNKKEAGET